MENKCIRCESLDRKQKGKKIYKVKNRFGDEIPVCVVCLEEIAEEEEYFNSLEKDIEDEPGGEDFN